MSTVTTRPKRPTPEDFGVAQGSMGSYKWHYHIYKWCKEKWNYVRWPLAILIASEMTRAQNSLLALFLIPILAWVIGFLYLLILDSFFFLIF